MKASDYVGRTLILNLANMPLAVRQQENAAYAMAKVVGYVGETLIVNAGKFGWEKVFMSEVIVEECETYWYVNIEDIKEIIK